MVAVWILNNDQSVSLIRKKRFWNYKFLNLRSHDCDTSPGIAVTSFVVKDRLICNGSVQSLCLL